MVCLSLHTWSTWHPPSWSREEKLEEKHKNIKMQLQRVCVWVGSIWHFHIMQCNNSQYKSCEAAEHLITNKQPCTVWRFFSSVSSSRLQMQMAEKRKLSPLNCYSVPDSFIFETLAVSHAYKKVVKRQNKCWTRVYIGTHRIWKPFSFKAE